MNKYNAFKSMKNHVKAANLIYLNHAYGNHLATACVSVCMCVFKFIRTEKKQHMNEGNTIKTKCLNVYMKQLSHASI